MRFFMDTEFIEDGKTIDLISIGIVSEDGREFYKQNQECEFDLANDFVARCVFPHLQEFDMGRRCPTGADKDARYVKDGVCIGNYQRSTGGWWRESKVWRMREEIKNDLLAYFNVIVGETGQAVDKPEIWTWYGDYDWVAFCQLFGMMVDLPKGFPFYARDLKQWCDQLGNPALPVQAESEHNALSDAKWNKCVWEFLSALKSRTFGTRQIENLMDRAARRMAQPGMEIRPMGLSAFTDFIRDLYPELYVGSAREEKETGQVEGPGGITFVPQEANGPF